MTSPIPVESAYYLIDMALFGMLGAFTLHRSIARKVFGITWIGSVFTSYAGYYLLIFLDLAGIIPHALGFVLEAYFFGIMFQMLVFTKSVFFKNRARGSFIALAILLVAIGICSCMLAAEGDMTRPYGGIFDIFDVWRYFIDDLIIGPFFFLLLFVSSVRAYRRSGVGMNVARRRLLMFGVSVLSIQALWVLNFFGSFTSGLTYEIFTVVTTMIAALNIVVLYMGWLTKGGSIRQHIDLSMVEHHDTGPDGETINTMANITTYRVIEVLGGELATLVHKSPQSCKGLLLLVILKQLGSESLSNLDLSALPSVFRGGLRDELRNSHVDEVDRVIGSVEAFFFDNYDIFSFMLY